MSWLRRAAGIVALAALFATAGVLAQPSPSSARANVACDLGGGAVGAVSGGVEAITGGAVGIGNPVGDVCNTVSGAVGGVVANPVTDALKSVGHGIFEQITDWVSEGAGWLIGEVVKGIDKSTSPKLTTKSFIAEYGRMAQIAAILGLAMLLLAVLEGVAQGNSAMLTRVVLVNVPLAFIATSVAYAVVQMLLVATDGLCHAIAATSHERSHDFFQGAITSHGNAAGDVGREIIGGSIAGEASGSVSAPLFVTFLVAIIGAFAAFLVWLELLMRDAAIYVVASFMPLSLAAAIWPRWASALRKTGELLVAVIGSKFVIVSILALAAGLMAKPEGRIEPMLAASALMVLACFAPFVLLKFVPFAEGAMNAAYSRRSAAGGVISGVQVASDIQILRNMARSNWGDDSGVSLWEAGDKGGGASPSPGGPRSGGSSGSGGGGAGSSGAGSGAASGGGGAAGAAGAAAAVPAATVGATKGASQRLQGTTAAKESGAATAAPAPAHGETASEGAEGTAATEKQGESAEKPPRPAADRPGVKPEKGDKG
jgi:type IV secretion system protein TrbL